MRLPDLPLFTAAFLAESEAVTAVADLSWAALSGPGSAVLLVNLRGYGTDETAREGSYE